MTTAAAAPDAPSVLRAIFTEFAIRRKQDKINAWTYLQTALAENAGSLVPMAVSLKDLISAVANVEDMLKGAAQGGQGKSPSEYLEGWLNSPTGAAQ